MKSAVVRTEGISPPRVIALPNVDDLVQQRPKQGKPPKPNSAWRARERPPTKPGLGALIRDIHECVQGIRGAHGASAKIEHMRGLAEIIARGGDCPRLAFKEGAIPAVLNAMRVYPAHLPLQLQASAVLAGLTPLCDAEHAIYKEGGISQLLGVIDMLYHSGLKYRGAYGDPQQALEDPDSDDGATANTVNGAQTVLSAHGHTFGHALNSDSGSNVGQGMPLFGASLGASQTPPAPGPSPGGILGPAFELPRLGRDQRTESPVSSPTRSARSKSASDKAGGAQAAAAALAAAGPQTSLASASVGSPAVTRARRSSDPAERAAAPTSTPVPVVTSTSPPPPPPNRPNTGHTVTIAPTANVIIVEQGDELSDLRPPNAAAGAMTVMTVPIGRRTSNYGGRKSSIAEHSNPPPPSSTLTVSGMGPRKSSSVNLSLLRRPSVNPAAGSQSEEFAAARRRAIRKGSTESGLENDVTRTLSLLFQEHVHGTVREGFFDDPSELMSKLEVMDSDERYRSLTYMALMLSRMGRLIAATNGLSAELSLDIAMDVLVSHARKILDAERVTAFMVDDDMNELWSISCTDPDAKKITVPLGKDIPGHVAATGETVNIMDAYKDPRFDTMGDRRDNVHTHAVLCVPVMSRVRKGHKRKVLAVLYAANKRGPDAHFDSEDELFLRLLSNQAGMIIQNFLDYHMILKTQKKFNVLLDTTRSLSSEVELDNLIQLIMQSASTLLDADRCTIFIVDKDELWTNILDNRGQVKEIRIKKDAGIAGAVATTGRILNIADAYADDRFNRSVDMKTGYRTKTILGMPIRNQTGEIIGVIQMINKTTPGPFNKDDEQLLNAFSSQAAVAIEKSKLFQKSTQMRRYLENILSSINSTVLTLSQSGTLVTCNRETIISYLQKPMSYMQSTPFREWLGEDNRALCDDIDTVFATGKPMFVTDYILRGPSGSIEVNYSLAPLEDQNMKHGSNYWAFIKGAVNKLRTLPQFKEPNRMPRNAEFELHLKTMYQISRQWRVQHEATGVVVVLEDISKEKKMMNTLGRYMSPSLAKQVLEEGGQKLGGTRQKVSVLFSDIRSFTKLSENMDPRELVDMLNEYFECAVDAIMANNGILDKYIGDSVMAVFGVPFVTADDTHRACMTALQMRRNFEVFNGRRVAKGDPPIGYGIGINTGEVVNGNIGSEKRMEYTVIGDGVNLASRVEGITKTYGVKILITEFTYEEVPDKFHVREVDRVRVVGKNKPIAIYELLAESDSPLPAELGALVGAYAAALAAMRARRWAEAISGFSKCLEMQSADGPSRVMLERCRQLEASPPDESWDGVYNAESK